jgi:hypothetical protein
MDLNDWELEGVWECEGSKAAREGKPASANPYPSHTLAGRSWADGHMLCLHSLNREKR